MLDLEQCIHTITLLLEHLDLVIMEELLLVLVYMNLGHTGNNAVISAEVLTNEHKYWYGTSNNIYYGGQYYIHLILHLQVL